jgi:hypothetical protein
VLKVELLVAKDETSGALEAATVEIIVDDTPEAIIPFVLTPYVEKLHV